MKLLPLQACKKGGGGGSIRCFMPMTLKTSLFLLLYSMGNLVCYFLVHWFIKRMIVNATAIAELFCSCIPCQA